MLPSNPDHTPLQEQFLFVYGTLMQGFQNPFALKLGQFSSFVGPGTFPGKLYRVSWYPGAVYLPDNSGTVFGEIYRLTDPETLLPMLDEYEEVHSDPDRSLYLRQIIPVIANNGAIFPCWTYIYNQSAEGLQEITDGKFPLP